MLRVFGGIFLGFLAMNVIVFAGLTAVYLAMGTDRAFEPESYSPSVLWLVCHFVVAILAAVAGGYVTKWVGRKREAIVGLVLIVLLFSGVTIAAELFAEKPDPGQRTGDVSNIDAMDNAKTPLWVSLLLPVIGAGGAVVGGRLRKTPPI